MLTDQMAYELLAMQGVILHGHFVGTQEVDGHKGLGLHMPVYIDGRVTVTKPKLVEILAYLIAARLHGYGIEAVVGMPIGAYTLGSEVAKALGVDYAMAERAGGAVSILRPAFVNVVRGRRVAVIEDTINNGDTLAKGVDGVKDCGGQLAAIGSVFDRGRIDPARFGVPLHALVRRQLLAVTREECLANGQCSRGEPINRQPGHGHDLERLLREGIVPNPGYTFV